MPLSGEAIRLMNYIDDVAVTLRRVVRALAAESSPEEIAAVLAKPLAAEVVIPVLPVKPA